MTRTSHSRNPWPSQHSELRLDCSIPLSGSAVCGVSGASFVIAPNFLVMVNGFLSERTRSTTRWSEEPIGDALRYLLWCSTCLLVRDQEVSQ